MPNQYNTPQIRTPQSNYVSQHVGLPLEEIEMMLQAKQGQYDATENLGISEKTRLGGINGIGTWAQNKLAEHEKDLEDFTKQYDGKDLGSAEVSKAFKQKVSDLAANQDLQNIQGFASKYKEYQANAEALRKSGDYARENDYLNQRALEKYSQSGDASGFDPVIDKGVNIHKEAEEYFKALKSDDVEVMRSIADGQGASVYYDNKQGGISSGKIMGQAGRVFHEFQASPAGRQATKRFMMENGLDVQDMQNPKVQQASQQYLAKILTNAGAGFEQHSNSSGLSGALNKAQDKADKKKEAKEAMSIPFTTIAGMSPHIPLDKDGTIVGEGGVFEAYEEGRANGNWKDGLHAAKEVLLGNRKNPVSQEQRTKYAPVLKGFEIANKQRTKQGKPAYSLPDYVRAVEATSGTKKQITLDVQMNPTVQSGYQKMFIDSKAILGIPMINTQNPSEVLTGDQVIRRLNGLDQDDLITEDMMKGLGILAGTTDTDYALEGMGVSVQGANGKQGVYLADIGQAKLMPNYTPTSVKEMQRITNFGRNQARLKGGVHEYYGYHKVNGKPTRAKIRTSYNPLAERAEDMYTDEIIK